MTTIKGKCVCVDIVERANYEPLLTISLEDDERWYKHLSISAHWLDDMIDVLHRTREQINKQNVK